MNAPNLKNLRPWVKGQSGNPKGTRLIPDNLRGILSLNQLEVTKLISKYARMTRKELLVCIKESPDLPSLDLAIANIFNQSIAHGDFSRLGFLLDRAIGKVPPVVETEEEYDERAELQKLSMKELLTLVKTHMPEEL